MTNPRSAVLLALTLLLTASGLGTAQNEKDPFVPGEKLTYDVTWSVFHAGEVTATLQDVSVGSHDEYEVITTARSEGFVSLLINIDNEFRSFFSPQTLCSQRIIKRVREGHRRKDTLIAFDTVRKLALLDERDLSLPGAPAKHAENPIPACVEDVVSAFYYLRRQPIEVGHTIELPVNDGLKTAQVVVEVQAHEKVQTPMGTIDTFRTEPKVFNGLLKRKGRMLIWFSADDQRLPVRIKAVIAAGSITGTLRSVTRQAPAPPPPAKP
jgi:hypothetical protein